jgi:hypothetical protein
MLLFVLAFSAAGTTGLCESVFPHGPDVGIYWASAAPETHRLAWEKSCIGAEPEIASSFDPARKTLIITHGLQPDFTEKRTRMWAETETEQFAVPWIEQGWNVGIFQWTQFADEPLAHFGRGQAKIWTPKYYTNMAFVYITESGDVRVADAPNDASIARLFVAHYLAHAAMIAPGTEIRMVGHSLGSQLVILTTFLLHSEHRGYP